MITLGCFGVSPLPVWAVEGAGESDLAGKSFDATDTLDIGEEAQADALECLKGLTWTAGNFQTTCERPTVEDRGDLLVRFPSPIDSGVEKNNRVAMEWYLARDDDRNPILAPGVVVVHESGRSMTVGRLIARGLRSEGVHAFLIHLPFYGERRIEGGRPDDVNIVTLMRQAIMDVRRARDAVASLPLIRKSHIAVQGTSLGGFVSATSASLDSGYDSVFLMLAGGQLYELIQHGAKDAAKVRKELAEAGLTGDRLRSLVNTIEPTRVAHRLDPKRTWLYSGDLDRVVPPKHASALAKAAGLDQEHHVRMLANHYSGILYLPFVLAHIRQQIASIERGSTSPQDR